MGDVTTQCESCGGALSEAGRCQECGSEQRQLEEDNERLMAAKVENLLGTPSAAALKTPPAGACLCNKGNQEQYSLSQSVSKIGRDQSNSIALPKDSYISRHHAWVLFIKGSYWVEDLGSTNGTLLNGELLTERRQIFPGDCLKLGRTELFFELS